MSPAVLVIHGNTEKSEMRHIIWQVMSYEIILTNQIEVKCDIQSKRYDRVYLNPAVCKPRAPIDTDLFSKFYIQT